MSKSSAITQQSLNAVKTVRIQGSDRFITGTNRTAAEGPTVGPRMEWRVCVRRQYVMMLLQQTELFVTKFIHDK